MKKLLTSLFSIALCSSTVATVVSCAPEKIDPYTLKGTYKSPMTNWNTASTMQAEDSYVLDNLEDTLIYQDRNGDYEGDLAYSWSKTESTSTDLKDEENSPETWKIILKDNIYWSDQDGKKQYQINGGDFFNAFRWVMNPQNLSSNMTAYAGYVLDGTILQSFTTNFQKYLGSIISNETERVEFIDIAILLFNIDSSKLKDSSAKSVVEKFITAAKLAATETTTKSTESTTSSSALDDVYEIEQEAFAKLVGTESKDPKSELVKISEENGRIFKATTEEIDGKEYNTLSVTLPNPTPYFESIMAFSPWSPLPDIALDYSKGEMSGFNYGTSPEKLWYSGAYIVKKNSYTPTGGMILLKNENYFEDFEGKVQKIILTYNDMSKSSRSRELYEVGDTSEAELSTADVAGWQKYIGSGDTYDSPETWGSKNSYNTDEERDQAIDEYVQKIQSSTTNDQTLSVKKVTPASYGLLFNYFPKSGDSYNNVGVLASKAVRTVISFLFDRNQAAQYYAQTKYKQATTDSELGIKLSPQTRNYFTTSDLVKYDDSSSGKTVKRDYIQDLDESYKNIIESATTHDNKVNTASESIDDGNDIYYHNIKLAISSLTENETSKEKYSEAISKLEELNVDNWENAARILIKAAASDLNNISKTGKTLKFLINGADKNTANLGIQDAIDTFNKDLKKYSDSGTIFTIKADSTTTALDYQNKLKSFTYDMNLRGWSPDYADPITFLNALKSGGDYDSYMGFDRCFDTVTETKENIKLSENVTKQSESVQEIIKDLGVEIGTYTSDLETANSTYTSANKERYTAIADVEAEILYKSQLFIPVYAPTATDVLLLTHINPFTRSSALSGVSMYRYFGLQIRTKNWTQKDYWDEYKNYLKNPDEYKVYKDYEGNTTK